MKEEIRKYAGLSICLFALYLAVTYWEKAAALLGLLLSAAQPLLLGAAIAYIVNLLMRLYEDKLFARVGKGKASKLKRPVCILLALASVVLIVVMVVWMILPELWASLQLLVSEVPDFLVHCFDLLEERFGFDWSFLDDLFTQLENLDWQKIAKQLFSGLGGAAIAAVSVFKTVAGSVIDFVVAVIFAVYILADKERLGRGTWRLLDTYLKSRQRDCMRYIAQTFDRCFGKFIVGQCVEAVILGVLCILGMLLLRIPYATMVGTLIGFTALIPVAGAYIGGIVGVLLIATVSPIKAVIFIVFLVVLQQLEGNLIYPRVVGSSIGLPGIWVLAAITVGGGVMGVLGMLLGVPLFAAIYQMIGDDVRRRERRSAPDPGEKEPREILTIPQTEPAASASAPKTQKKRRKK